MLTLFLEILVIGFFSGIAAAVYRQILAYEPVLQWWFKFGNRYEKKWFFAPVWGCVKCISGQIGLWSFVFLEILPALFADCGQNCKFGGPSLQYTGNPAAFVLGLIFTICTAILVAIGVARVISIIEQK